MGLPCPCSLCTRPRLGELQTRLPSMCSLGPCWPLGSTTVGPLHLSFCSPGCPLPGESLRPAAGRGTTFMTCLGSHMAHFLLWQAHQGKGAEWGPAAGEGTSAEGVASSGPCRHPQSSRCAQSGAGAGRGLALQARQCGPCLQALPRSVGLFSRPPHLGGPPPRKAVLSMNSLSYGVVRVDTEEKLSVLTVQDVGQVMPGGKGHG